jgi:hypothetical protein
MREAACSRIGNLVLVEKEFQHAILQCRYF